MRRFSAALAAVGLLLTFYGIGRAAEPKRGGRLIIAQDEGPDRIDPHGTSNAFQYTLITSGWRLRPGWWWHQAA